MIGKLICFGAGIAIGWIVADLILKRQKKKEDEKQEQLEREATEEENSRIEEDFDQARKEVQQMLKEKCYVKYEDEADDEDLDPQDMENVSDLEEYLSEIEHPEDDIPEERTPIPELQQFTEDEFYTTNQDFEKTVLYFSYGTELSSKLYDLMGDDYIKFFTDNGYGIEKLYSMFVNARKDYLYFTSTSRQCDYEVYLEEPDEGPI